jgi:hypothetical protein
MDRAEHPGTNEMTRHGLRKRSVRPGDRRGDARTPVMESYAARGSTALCISVALINQPPVNIREADLTWLLFLLKRSLRDGTGRGPWLLVGLWMPSFCLRLLAAVLAAYPCGRFQPEPSLFRPGSAAQRAIRATTLAEHSESSLFRRVTTTLKQEPDSHFHPQSPRAHSKGRPPKG